MIDKSSYSQSERLPRWDGPDDPAGPTDRRVEIDGTRSRDLYSTAPPGQSRGYTTLLLATQGRRVTSSNIDKKTTCSGASTKAAS